MKVSRGRVKTARATGYLGAPGTTKVTLDLDFTSVRRVLFDLDGTLYRQAPLRVLMALELATLPLDGPFRAAARLRALKAYRRAQEELRGTALDRPGEAQLAAAADASGLPVAEIEGLVADWMHRRPLKYLQACRAPGLDRLLEVMERAGLPAGVLSDYPAQAKLAALGLDGRFAPVLSATDPEVGAFKPSPRGFLRACEVWGVEPGEALFVGDRADVDAAGAEAAGMPCAIISRRPAPGGARYVVFESLEQLSRVIDSRR